jgi:hypothetical protein
VDGRVMNLRLAKCLARVRDQITEPKTSGCQEISNGSANQERAVDTPRIQVPVLTTASFLRLA